MSTRGSTISARQGQHLLLATGQGAGGLLAPLPEDGEQRERTLQRLLPRTAVGDWPTSSRPTSRTEPDVTGTQPRQVESVHELADARLRGRRRGKQLGVLEGPVEAAARPHLRGRPGDVLAAHTGLAVIGGLRQAGWMGKPIISAAGYGDLQYAKDPDGIPGFAQSLGWFSADLFLHGLELAGCDASQEQYMGRCAATTAGTVAASTRSRRTSPRSAGTSGAATTRSS